MWQVCWVATCPILSVMLADSSALFSERCNMWKKLVFYISQLVTSSLLWTLTSHCAPNTPHGKCPHTALWESCVPLATYGKNRKCRWIETYQKWSQFWASTQITDQKLSHSGHHRLGPLSRDDVGIRISSGCITATHIYDIQVEISGISKESKD